VPNLWERQIFELACCQAALAGLAGKDGSGVPATDGPSEAAKAMDLLSQAVASGYRNLHNLRNDRGLDALRKRDDFKKLLGTDRELSANFDQESSATRVERDVSGDVGAYFNVARHAVKCAEQRRTQDGA
jgi:hypothetical protein